MDRDELSEKIWEALARRLEAFLATPGHDQVFDVDRVIDEVIAAGLPSDAPTLLRLATHFELTVPQGPPADERAQRVRVLLAHQLHAEMAELFFAAVGAEG